jgi:GNAT superfamily N-acetyltransferase
MIRKASVNDLKSLAEINTNAWQINYRNIIEDDFLKIRTVELFIQKRTESRWLENVEINTFVYEENNCVKGFISGRKLVEKYDCEIEGLYVDPQFQQNGIGSKLLSFMKEFYANQGCKNMIIWTINGLKNDLFYKKHGGIILEEKELDYGGKKYKGNGYIYDLELCNKWERQNVT